MIKAFVSILLLVIVIFLLKKYIKDFKIFESEKDKLFDFLNERNEYDALKKLGAINSFNVREKRHIPSRKIKEYLIARNDLSNEEEIKLFLLKIDNFDKSYMTNVVTSFLLIFVLIFLNLN